ncbi:MAG: hypothetical protein J0I20_01245 [Chloroflexi bacterium]|nr:hypothetical protein [Chloroflexota bacterium]OJV89585.1 MAG: hypothetical protein BGO39_37135 [Chloroflexi bacterium 54-19]
MQPNQVNLEQSLYHELNAAFGGRLQPHFQRKSSLITLSHILEDQVLNRALSPVIFTAFQKARYYNHEKPRYDRLDQLARAVTIFGEDLPGGLVFQHEWFIVINEPRFKALIASYELNTADFLKLLPDGSELLPGEGNRLFVGFWSYDPEIVDFATRLLAQMSHPFTQATVEQLLSEPLEPEEQFRCVTEVSDLILNHLEKTNLKMLDQIKSNQQLLTEVTRQSQQLHLLTRLDRLDDRQKLHQELLALYNETAWTHTLLHQATFKQIQAEKSLEAARNLMPLLQAELDLGEAEGQNEALGDLLSRLKSLLAQPSPPEN